jgi:hypothetical protein
MWDPTICAHPILPSNATPRAPQTGRAIIDNDDNAPPHPIPAVHTGSPGRHRVQLVRRVAQEPSVRGSNPSGARVQWNEGCAEPLVGG